jgi:hypothetical protein
MGLPRTGPATGLLCHMMAKTRPGVAMVLLENKSHCLHFIMAWFGDAISRLWAARGFSRLLIGSG